MQLGLLQCGHIPEEFHGVTGGDNEAIFSKHFDRYAQGVTIRPFDVFSGIYPDSIDDCDGYIMTGSRFSVYDDELWVHRLKEYVAELYLAKKKFVGICFGHQMIAEALGGKVTKSSRGWGIGAHDFTVDVYEPWMNPPLERYTILMSCQDQVEVLPSDSTVLAGNQLCPVGMYRVGHHFLGIQGHPEFTPGFSRLLMERRTDRIPAETIDSAMQTLDNPLHTQELTDWIVNFIDREILD